MTVRYESPVLDVAPASPIAPAGDRNRPDL